MTVRRPRNTTGEVVTLVTFHNRVNTDKPPFARAAAQPHRALPSSARDLLRPNPSGNSASIAPKVTVTSPEWASDVANEALANCACQGLLIGAPRWRDLIMDSTTGIVLVGGLLGFFPGFLIGRLWAENARARSDMAKTWRSRKDYR